MKLELDEGKLKKEMDILAGFEAPIGLDKLESIVMMRDMSYSPGFRLTSGALRVDSRLAGYS